MIINLKKYFSVALVVFSFTACQKNSGVLNKEEHQRVISQAASVPMELFVINNYSDSLFLREPSRDVDADQIANKNLVYFRERLLATVKDTLDPGVGIAAPQVGVGLRIIYVQRFDKQNEPFEVYYNPQFKILGDSTQIGREGCLSVPGYWGNVERSNSIELSYLDSLGKPQKEEIIGFTAVIFQHEIDHVNGVLYYDRVSGGFEALEKEIVN